MNNSTNASKTVGAVALGLLAGTAIGVLFAPHKGSKTREKIAGKANKMAKNMKQKVTNELKAFKKNTKKLEKNAEEQLTELKKGIEKSAQDLLNHKQ